MNHLSTTIGTVYTYERAIAFADTDMSGRVHFTMVLRYVEEAEHAFFASISEPVTCDTHGWPRVHVTCDYRSALSFGDRATVKLVVTEVGNRSLKYCFTVDKNETLCAEGNIVIVRISK